MTDIFTFDDTDEQIIDFPDSIESLAGQVKFKDAKGDPTRISLNFNEDDKSSVYLFLGRGNEDFTDEGFCALTHLQALTVYNRLEEILSDVGVLSVESMEADHLNDLDVIDQVMDEWDDG